MTSKGIKFIPSHLHFLPRLLLRNLTIFLYFVCSQTVLNRIWLCMFRLSLGSSCRSAIRSSSCTPEIELFTLYYAGNDEIQTSLINHSGLTVFSLKYILKLETFWKIWEQVRISKAASPHALSLLGGTWVSRGSPSSVTQDQRCGPTSGRLLSELRRKLKNMESEH